MHKQFMVLIAVLASLSVQAQYSYKLAGDRFYVKGDYTSAAHYYMKYFNGEVPARMYSPYNFPKQGARIIDNSTIPSETAFRLGHCYWSLNEYNKAELLFKALVAEKPDEFPQARVMYATCLRAKGQLEDAIIQLELFTKQYKKTDTYSELAQRELDACLFAQDKQKNQRPQRRDTSNLKDRSSLQGNRKYETRTLEYADGRTTMAIFVSEQVGDKWTYPTMILGDDSVNYAMPALAANGKYLLLASDRKGSLGGYDLWYAELNEKGRPIQLLNMGAGVNTSDDDVEPFYASATNTLVFASKGRTVSGNYDLFEAIGQIGGEFTNATNLASVN